MQIEAPSGDIIVLSDLHLGEHRGSPAGSRRTVMVDSVHRAVATFPRRSLRPAQYPLLAAMVAFTAGGIVLVTAP